MFIATFRVSALDPSRSISQYNVRTWTRQNGLPANAVTAVLQTPDGYLWLGTPMGLVRFDGIEFKLLDMSQFHSPSVNSLCGSGQTGFWFGLANGAFGSYDGRALSFRGQPEWGGLNLTVNAVLETKGGDVWVAAQNLAYRLRGGTNFEPILNTATGKDFYDVLTAYPDSHGRIWLGTVSRGLFYWYDGVLTRFPDPLVNTRLIYSVAEDKLGQLWIGTESGLLCYDAQFQKKEIPLAWFQTCALLVDREGAVWAGTSGGGLVRYLNGTATQFQKAEGLPDDFVTALAEDQEGSVWVGTRNGLCQLSDVKIPTFGKAEGLTADSVLSVFPSHRGGLWVTTGGGLVYFDGKVHPYPANRELHNQYLKRVLEDRRGDLYVINGSMDIEVLSAGKVVARYPNKVWPTALTEDAQGVVAAVDGVLYRVGTNSFEPYLLTGQKPTKCWMFNLTAGRDGSIWTASAEGICRVKDGAATIVTGPDPLGGDAALYLYEDSDGVIWAGLQSGIARIKDGQVRYITRKDGLFDNIIYAMVPDAQGFFWVDSGRGFFRVSRQGLNNFADGKSDHVKCIAYDGTEAAKTFERNQQEPVGCKTLDGRIWFPTALGAAMIDPTNITANLVPPQIHIQSARANGQDLAGSGPAAVAPGEGDLEFHYAGLGYIAPEKIQYRYKLDGHDKNWVGAGTRRSAFYTNLKPGRYRFQVQACNENGIWNTAGTGFAVELLPHYYQTGWFLAGTGLLAVAAAFGLYGWRVKHLERRRRQLQRAHDLLEDKVQARTAELARSNATLMTEVEERKRMQLEVERIHHQLLDASRRAGQAEVASSVLHNVGNVLNSVNVSASLVVDRLQKLDSVHLLKATELMETHAADLARFLTEDAKGRHLPNFLGNFAKHLGGERKDLLVEVRDLRDKIDHIKEIVALQQSYAGAAGLLEKVPITELVESALKMHSAAYTRHSVNIVRDYQAVPSAVLDKHRVLQVLVNILHNAKYACDEGGKLDKQVTVRIRPAGPDRVEIVVVDNGIGIEPGNLTRIFSHGFTTRRNGHGFGLHSAALAAQQMGGKLVAASDGPGRGATFTLELPLQPSEDQSRFNGGQKPGTSLSNQAALEEKIVS